jgi:hypothetical protein
MIKPGTRLTWQIPHCSHLRRQINRQHDPPNVTTAVIDPARACAKPRTLRFHL